MLSHGSKTAGDVLVETLIDIAAQVTAEKS